MKLITTIIKILLISILAGCFTNCAGVGMEVPVNPPIEPGRTIAYFWLGASKDAYVTSKIPEMSNPGSFSLVCSHGIPNGEQRTYIDFFMPQLPEGTVVLEAYINVYEDSRTGQPGWGAINIGTANGPWDPATITWNDQPNPVGPLSVGTSIGPFISELMWRGSGDLKNVVQDQLDNPAANFGWILDNQGPASFTRSFTAMNALNGRTQTDFGFGPRLLIKVESPVPLNMDNIGVAIQGVTELGDMYGFNNDFLVYLVSYSNAWPAEWELSLQ